MPPRHCDPHSTRARICQSVTRGALSEGMLFLAARKAIVFSARVCTCSCMMLLSKSEPLLFSTLSRYTCRHCADQPHSYYLLIMHQQLAIKLQGARPNLGGGQSCCSSASKPCCGAAWAVLLDVYGISCMHVCDVYCMCAAQRNGVRSAVCSGCRCQPSPLQSNTQRSLSFRAAAGRRAHA